MEMQTTENLDAWIWWEWSDIEPGGEAVDMRDLAGEVEIGSGENPVHQRTGEPSSRRLLTESVSRR